MAKVSAKWLSTILLWIIIVAASAPAAATDGVRARQSLEMQSRTAGITMLRFTGLFMHAEAVNMGATWTLPLLGFQLERVFDNRLAVEGAANFLWGTEGTGWDVAARAGYAVQLSEAGRTKTLVTPLVGYHLAHRPVIEGSDGYNLFNRTHSAQGGVAMDVVWPGDVGFTLRLFTAVEYAFISETRPNAFEWDYSLADPMRTSIQMGLSLGMVIR